VKIRYIIERLERCIRITYLGSGSGGNPDTVLELPLGPEETVGANKKKVQVYYKGIGEATIAIDGNQAFDWNGGVYVFVVDCEKYKFVQYKRRSSKLSTDAAAKTGDWEIDGSVKDNSKPFGGTIPKPKDGSGDKSGASYDFPGSAGTPPDSSVPDGTTLAVSDEFQTFVCCDGQPLGYWEWSVTRTFKYRGEVAIYPPTVDASKPVWHAPGDSKNAVNCA